MTLTTARSAPVAPRPDPVRLTDIIHTAATELGHPQAGHIAVRDTAMCWKVLGAAASDSSSAGLVVTSTGLMACTVTLTPPLWAAPHPAYQDLPLIAEVKVGHMGPTSLVTLPRTWEALRITLLDAMTGLWWHVAERTRQGPRGWSPVRLCDDPDVQRHFRCVTSVNAQLGQPGTLHQDTILALLHLRSDALRIVGARANYLSNEIGSAARYLTSVADLALHLSPPSPATPAMDGEPS